MPTPFSWGGVPPGGMTVRSVGFTRRAPLCSLGGWVRLVSFCAAWAFLPCCHTDLPLKSAYFSQDSVRSSDEPCNAEEPFSRPVAFLVAGSCVQEDPFALLRFLAEDSRVSPEWPHAGTIHFE